MTAHDRTRLRLQALADQRCSEAADLAAKLTPTQMDELQLGRALMRHIGQRGFIVNQTGDTETTINLDFRLWSCPFSHMEKVIGKTR